MKRESVKYLFLVGDGMADYPLPELGGRSPLEAAGTPNMDRIAACRIGLARTIPNGMEPGSDVANLSLMGYDPRIYHTGRAPLEAASLGLTLGPGEVAFRMNLVALDRRSENEIFMLSHSSGDISAEEGRELVEHLQSALHLPGRTIYPGVAYRNLLIWTNGPRDIRTIPPHDVLGQNMDPYLSSPENRAVADLIRLSWRVLDGHPVNLRRRQRGLKEANSIWPWGQGTAPTMPTFLAKYGLKGGVISAVDLIKGIGVCAGFERIAVAGVTGYLNTNFVGKAKEAVKALERLDFVFVHVEAPDEASHNGNIEEKIRAIEAFDEKVVGTALRELEAFEDYRVLVVSDHLTPIPVRTHTTEPTPFAWAAKRELQAAPAGRPFVETSAAGSGLFYDKGHELMADFLFSK
jgi:2,3-bisphosphoglycerate-independent phosphoglycerate mutase